jgi:hypothetical protein
MTNPFALDTPVTTPPPPTAPAFIPPTAPIAPPLDDGDPFSGPAPQAPRGPRLRDSYGRLLLLIPRKLEEDVPNLLQPGTTQDRMTADVVILDGGPISYGGTPETTPSIPHTKVAGVPFKTDRMFISSVGLISQCREALAKRAQGKPGMVLGRLTVGQQSKPGLQPPWLLTPPTDADKAIGRAYLATVDPFA